MHDPEWLLLSLVDTGCNAGITAFLLPPSPGLAVCLEMPWAPGSSCRQLWEDENCGCLVTLPSLRWTSSLRWQCLGQAGMFSWWNISVRIYTRRWACLCTPLREPPSKGCSTSTPAHTGKLRTGKGGWEDPAQGFPFTVRASLSSLCRSPARDTQHHLAVFYLDSEASIRLTAEQAHFFLVKPLEPFAPGWLLLAYFKYV